MKIITSNTCPPIPFRSADWEAYFDGREDGPRGFGASERDALVDLLWNVDPASAEETAIQARIDEVDIDAASLRDDRGDRLRDMKEDR